MPLNINTTEEEAKTLNSVDRRLLQVYRRNQAREAKKAEEKAIQEAKEAEVEAKYQAYISNVSEELMEFSDLVAEQFTDEIEEGMRLYGSRYRISDDRKEAILDKLNYSKQQLEDLQEVYIQINEYKPLTYDTILSFIDRLLS